MHEAAQRGAADVGTGPQANESDSFALAEIPQNLPLERLNNPKDRLKAAIKQLAAAQRCLARERERWQQAIVAEESTEVQNAAEARYDTALNDVQEATLIVETREREVSLKITFFI